MWIVRFISLNGALRKPLRLEYDIKKTQSFFVSYLCLDLAMAQQPSIEEQQQ